MIFRLSPEPEHEVDSDGEYYKEKDTITDEPSTNSTLDDQISEIIALVDAAPFYRIVRWIELLAYSYACLYIFVHCFVPAEQFH